MSLYWNTNIYEVLVHGPNEIYYKIAHHGLLVTVNWEGRVHPWPRYTNVTLNTIRSAAP